MYCPCMYCPRMYCPCIISRKQPTWLSGKQFLAGGKMKIIKQLALEGRKWMWLSAGLYSPETRLNNANTACLIPQRLGSSRLHTFVPGSCQNATMLRVSSNGSCPNVKQTMEERQKTRYRKPSRRCISIRASELKP